MSEFFLPFLGIDTSHLTKKEILLLEAKIFIGVCEELKEYFKAMYSEYFQMIKCDKETENLLMEERFVRNIINDILTTKEYTLPGITYYTSASEDVILDITTGKNTNPSLQLSHKIIKLHCSVKSELYKEILRKVIKALQEI